MESVRRANAIVPPYQVGTFGQFVSTTTQVRDFFGFIQQFRPPAPITPPMANP